MAYQTQEQWVEIRKGGDFAAVAEQFCISPVIARLLRNRDITDTVQIRRFLRGNLDDLEDPCGLDHAREAAAFLHDRVLSGARIRVIGDYDADGVCAAFILYDTLKRSGALVDYDIPDRIRDGFGLNVRLIEDAASDGVDTIITCDNGIAARDAVQRAKELGMRVIITDHHEPNFLEEADGSRTWLLPEADLIVDPKKPGCGYPNKDICGAGVAWKLMQIYESLYMPVGNGGTKGSDVSGGSAGPGGSAGHDGPDGIIFPVRRCPVTMEHLPFAAIATVTDVMKLTGENRILVRTGLSMIGESRNAGLHALLAQTGILGKALGCYDVGFILGPCLNAGGRLDSAKRSVALLTEQDPSRAMQMASELSSLNSERKEMTEDGKREASRMIEESSLLNDKILIVYLPGIHESVAGIIASKVKESYNRPVIILTDSEDPDILKGSGRSIEAWNMFEGLSFVSDLFVKFGGHAMAAGISIRRDRLEELRRRLNADCALTEEDLVKKVRIDMRLPLSYVSEDLVNALRILEPFGTGNRSVLFAQSGLKALRMRVLGQKRNAVKFLLDDQGTRMEAMWFGDASRMESWLEEKYGETELARLKLGEENNIRLAVCYVPEINEFRGVRTVQIRIAHFR